MATNLSLKNQLKARSIMAKETLSSETLADRRNNINITMDLVENEKSEQLVMKAIAEEPEKKLGYKAYLQLALRTGLYKTLNVVEVYSGQLKLWDPVTERLVIDQEAKEGRAIIGYGAYFEMFNGFKKCLYFSRSSLENRNKRRLAHDNNYKRLVLKELLSKWGILSLDTQVAYVPELHEEVLLYKPLLKDEEIIS